EFVRTQGGVDIAFAAASLLGICAIAGAIGRVLRPATPYKALMIGLGVQAAVFAGDARALTSGDPAASGAQRQGVELPEAFKFGLAPTSTVTESLTRKSTADADWFQSLNAQAQGALVRSFRGDGGGELSLEESDAKVVEGRGTWVFHGRGQDIHLVRKDGEG